MSETSFDSSLSVFLAPLRKNAHNVDIRIMLMAQPLTVPEAQAKIASEIASLFPAASEDMRPNITLSQDTHAVSARGNFEDIAKILSRYRMKAWSENNMAYAPLEETPQLNEILRSLAFGKEAMVVPYQGMNELAMRRIMIDLNSHLKEKNRPEEDIQVTQTASGLRLEVPVDTMLYLDNVARDHLVGEPDELHKQRHRDLGEGLGMVRSRGFCEAGMKLPDIHEDIFEPLPAPDAKTADGQVIRSFEQRLAEKREKQGGASPSIMGDGKSGEVVDMRGRPWTKRGAPENDDPSRGGE